MSDFGRNNDNREQRKNMIHKAFQQAGCGPNEFINALLCDLPDFNPNGNNPNDLTDSLNALISSGQFTDNFGSTVDFDQSSKGSKWKNFDDEDNQDINGGDTSNSCDDDNLGINSHGSSQGLSQSSGICNKPCSSTPWSAASPPHAYENDGTMMVLPTSS